MVTTPRREEWCEHCLHPIDPNEAIFVEAYRLVSEFERKIYFHDRCFNPASLSYLDAQFRYSDGLMIPVKTPSMPAVPRRAAHSRGSRAHRLRNKAHRSRRARRRMMHGTTPPTRGTLFTIS
jgi:hypothetical protein